MHRSGIVLFFIDAITITGVVKQANGCNLRCSVSSYWLAAFVWSALTSLLKSDSALFNQQQHLP
jgi:hypothetical protein